MKLKITVQNVQQMQPALPVSCTFSQRGGIIGSDGEITWQVQDLSRSIPENAARIVVIDGHFTIESFEQAKIYINGATAPLVTGRVVILSDKDQLQIGELKCLIEVASQDQESRQAVESMSSFVIQNSDAGEALSIDGKLESASTVDETLKQERIPDPLDALDSKGETLRVVDPVAVLDERHNRAEAVVREDKSFQAESTRPDGANTARASVMLRKVKQDRYGFEEEVGSGDNFERQRAEIDVDNAVDHVALRPLTRALGLPLGDMSTDQAAHMLADIGGALRAAVGGVNAIYRSRAARNSRFPLTTLHFHAIEDNPLRFSQNTDEALHAMFAKRGAVHLSAPAAMQEAVRHFNVHQSASEQATNKALDAVLSALMPAILERRFRAYSPDGGPKEGENKDAWCWDMYKAYFSELKSQRQQGLQMLFWEVFQHEYQRILREHELNEGGDDLHE